MFNRVLNTRRTIVVFAAILSLGAYALAFGSTGAGSPTGEGILEILLELVVILLAAKLGGDLFERLGLPPVLGELVLGIVIGNLRLFGIPVFDGFARSITLEILAELGVIILLFQVGLESTVQEMRKVGWTSLLVAVFGIAAPFALGWMVSNWFLPEETIYVHAFIGATLCATSVGITARVLKDLDKATTREAHIILGAAVIDDILGLIILSVVTGIISAAAHSSADGVSFGTVLWIVAKATLFLFGALAIGSFLVPQVFKFALRLRGTGVFLSFCLLVCFGLSYLSGKAGLAPIVGAFAAGLILDKVPFQAVEDRGKHYIEELIAPIAVFLVPIFFVRMGTLVDLTTFSHISILGFAAVLTLAAIVGKQACSLAIFDRTTNRLAVGLGMIPRGEVGLIFAGIGASLVLNGHPVVSPQTYSAVIIMVIVTTLVTPPLLKWSLQRGARRSRK
ncbi:cation:proton antiporter [candidate division GN15 bacterium]|uniref:Cation:proton antiporter n=1 Tax=candidate division GN15 bacterium TaxID=2072418 RepID=A0A855X3J2_9BACT|nr:MAG: cation:proton antiporter [candidate division GN15 bacterium]